MKLKQFSRQIGFVNVYILLQTTLKIHIIRINVDAHTACLLENICYSYYTIFLLGKQGQSKVCQIKKRYSHQAISVPMINFSNKKDSQTHPTILGLVRRRQPLFYIILYYICIKNASSLCCQIGTERSCYVDNNFVVHL